MSLKTPALSHPPVEVNANDFYEAISKLPKMKRGPIGSRGLIPKDTRFAPYEGGIMVETPVMSSLVFASAPWRVLVSVDARKLLDACDRYKKLGVYKAPKPMFLISVADGELRVKFKTTTVGIPHL